MTQILFDDIAVQRAVDRVAQDEGLQLQSNLLPEFLAPIFSALQVATDSNATPPLLGVCGSQGSGKSTVSALISTAVSAATGANVAVMSLDDFYLTKRERETLAQTVHPLCATRGVPGTHDVDLLKQTIAGLRSAGANTTTRIPTFTKLKDDRAPEAQWQTMEGRPGLIILEGWCVGARPEHPLDTDPINALEAEEDANADWRGWVNQQLAERYLSIFENLDTLLFIECPDFDFVVESRYRQELRNADRSGLTPMSRAQVERFVMFYERLTLAMKRSLPALANFHWLVDTNYEYRQGSERA